MIVVALVCDDCCGVGLTVMIVVALVYDDCCGIVFSVMIVVALVSLWWLLWRLCAGQEYAGLGGNVEFSKQELEVQFNQSLFWDTVSCFVCTNFRARLGVPPQHRALRCVACGTILVTLKYLLMLLWQETKSTTVNQSADVIMTTDKKHNSKPICWCCYDKKQKAHQQTNLLMLLWQQTKSTTANHQWKGSRERPGEPEDNSNNNNTVLNFFYWGAKASFPCHLRCGGGGGQKSCQTVVGNKLTDKFTGMLWVTLTDAMFGCCV